MSTSVATSTLAELYTSNASEYAYGARLERLTLGEIYKELRQLTRTWESELAHEGLSKMYEYGLSVLDPGARVGDQRLSDRTRLNDLRYRWIAVFAVTGSNEGHYVHVEIVWDQPDNRETGHRTACLFLVKTFNGLDSALELVRRLSRVLGV